MKHVGDLVIETEADARKYAGVTEVTGYLDINSSAKLDALTSVGGGLCISGSAKLDAPALTSVGGDLYISGSAKLDAPALTSVGGGLCITGSAKLDALTSVGGYLYINSSAKLDALTSVGGGLYINSSAKLDAPALYAKGFSNFRVYDGIPCALLSEKQQDGVTVLFCRRAQIKKQKIIGDKFYVAQQGNYRAHGQTIAEAVQELAYKTGTRDVEQYRGMAPSTRKTPQEWAVIYRTITGACQFGVRDFMQRKGKLKAKYTLRQIIDETKGAYGHERFVEVVGGAQ